MGHLNDVNISEILVFSSAMTTGIIVSAGLLGFTLKKLFQLMK